jgi:rifampicin phosphotransferase
MRVVYKCEDGADFPVDWENEHDARVTWFSEREHLSKPILPFEADTVPRLLVPSTARAFQSEGLELPAMLDFQFKIANGWTYITVPERVQEKMGPYWATVGPFNDRNGGPLGVWERVCVPRVKALAAELASAGENSSPERLSIAQLETWGFTMVAMVATFLPTFELMGLLGQEFGPDGERLVGTLTAGYRNATVDADEDLWQLAQRAKRSDAVSRTLRSGPPFDRDALRGDSAFWHAFSGYLSAYGERPDHWQLSAPTLLEQPDKALAGVKQIVENDTPSPLESLRRAALAREQALSDTAARLGNPAKEEKLRALVSALACYTPVREGRAYWQLISWGRLRLALLRIGARLVREGRIEQAEDALYLTVAEIEGAGTRDMRDAVGQRRADWERALSMAAPLAIGAPGPTDIVGAMAPPRPEAPVTANQMRGAPASSGTKRGPARLITSPEDGRRLQPGEVMVCTLTAPPWTPLFAVAGALVTETGGVLSHPSIVAREYGIPCVVGVRNAMRRIREGQMVTVNGDAGIVTLEG